MRLIEEHRVLVFMELVKAYYENPDAVRSKAFEDKVEASFVWLDRAQEDIFVMSFYAWLKNKFEINKLYATTLKLINL